MESSILFLVFAAIIKATNCAIPLKFISDLDSQFGLGWPHTLNITEGHEALLKLSKPLVNYQSCLITTPMGVQFNVDTPPSTKYSSWGDDHCGVRVRNVDHADEGRWRITAVRGEDSITAFSEVFVENATVEYSTSPILLNDGAQNAVLNFTVDSSSYCVVTQPFSDSALMPGACLVSLERANRAIQGTWSISLGLPGRVPELNLERHVGVEAERLDVGFIHDTEDNKLHLYCNILHTHKNISFCRFQTTTSVSGYNLLDGLSDGHYSYYGEGYARKQCGMTIESPVASDYTSWRCSVGFHEMVDDHRVEGQPMQALITVPHTNTRNIQRETPQSEAEPRMIFVQRDTSVTITCRTDVPLAYCWFQAPDSSQYTPVEKLNEEQEFWYTGDGIHIGDCGIVFSQAKEEFDGPWTCHMGPSNQLGIEITDQVHVRVTGALAAYEQEVGTNIGSFVDLSCQTANGVKPLGYCRFLTPNGIGMNVDATVTADLAILDRYYFTPGKDLNFGQCSLTIHSVDTEDLGEWTCAALVDGEAVESRATITVYIGAATPATRSRASVVGMALGLVFLVVVLFGALWLKRDAIGKPWRRTGSTSGSSGIEIDIRSQRSSVSASSSEVSAGP